MNPETPEQWAERMLAAQAYHHPSCNPEVFAELAAVKRKADACDLWRAELLAAEGLTREMSLTTMSAHRDARAARIAAGLT